MKHEQDPFKEVCLTCNDCGKQSDVKPRDEHVDEGWNWQEFEINDKGVVRFANCSSCFEAEQFKESVQDYIQNRIKDNKSLEQFA